MLINAMDSFQLAKREHKENVKGQHTNAKGSNGEVTYFRASGLGDADRKQIYKFFAHNLPKKEKSAQNLRQLENGDYVHDRYQTAWEEMGILISMEERLSSKNDEYLAQFDWELAGHYDGLLDVNIMHAHANGLAKVSSVFNEETSQWEIEVELDEVFAKSIGFYDENGEYNEEYEPLAMVADIKTMNPWGFKAIKDKSDVSDIQGYIDQIMSYMYFHNTPYGSIFIESKDNNATVEVQVLWSDLHNTEEDPYIYEWDEYVHGAPSKDKVRIVVDSDRFFGTDEVEGVIPRLSRLWDLRNRIIEADKAGDMATMREIFPKRCSDDPMKFPCSWGHKQGKPQYCEFYDHCWNSHTEGIGIRPYEAVPAECIWEFNDDETGEIIRVDNRLVPAGIDQDAFATLVQMGGLVLEKFVIPNEVEEPSSEVDPEDTAFNADNIFGAGGELILAPIVAGDAPSEATEYLNERKQKAIDCLNCGKQITYQKLANGGTKKCPHCKHTNVVKREG